VHTRKDTNVKLEDFKLVTVLGRGTFGKVYLAELRQNKLLYAIKSIRKDVLLEFDQVNNTKLEKDILFSCDHPFLVGMDYLFQSSLRLYFVMPFVRGGELYKIFQSKKRFPENVVKFYAAQIALAIGYLHVQGIAHRDLKLENILLDSDGYLKIIDFGLAKMIGQGKSLISKLLISNFAK
jgi:serine/threonine protein kinase